jgi:hypothetical protein
MSAIAMNRSGPVDCTSNYENYPDTQENPCNVCLNTSAVIGLAVRLLTLLLTVH